MTNRVVLVGRLTHDPEIKYSDQGKGRVKFSLAVNRPFKNKDGEYDADFPRVLSFRNAENIAEYTKKGSLVAVDGRIQTSSFDGENGKVFMTEIVADSVQFLDSKKDSEPKKTLESESVNSGSMPTSEEDLPFMD